MENSACVSRFMVKTRDKQNELGLLRQKKKNSGGYGYVKNKHFTLRKMGSTAEVPMLNEQLNPAE